MSSDADRPLDARQQRAAELLGRGVMAKDAAAEVGVSEKAIQRWRKREDFAELVRQSRRRVLDENPTAEATLEAALNATRRDGSPDWNVRVQAARALIGSTPPGVTPEEQVRETVIYLGEGDRADA